MLANAQPECCLEGKPKVNVFADKVSDFGPHAEQTNTTKAYHRRGLGNGALSCWAIFVILQQKNSTFNAFLISFRTFGSHINN